MLKPEGDPWFKRFFRRGVNKDLDPLAVPEDQARDAQNMRPLSVNGFAGSVTKIGGEAVLDGSNVPGQNSYTCVGAVIAGGHRVSFWASSNPGAFPPRIKIDGVVMAEHPDIPYTFNHLMQMPMTLQDGCETGLIYPVDGNAPALFWDVQDIIDNFNSGSVKYFSGFVITSQFVNPTVPSNFPKFIGLKDVGAPSGVPAGQVRYAIRYTFGDGDNTNIGLWTPLIPIPFSSETPTNPVSPYPGGRSTGSDPLPDPLGTRYATVLNYRIDNYNNFTSIEIIRQAFTDGQGLFSTGDVRIVGRFNLAAQQWTPVATFQDPQDSNVSEVIPPDEVPIELLDFTKPWTSEYSASRLEYGNVQLASSIPAGVTFREVNGNKSIPFTKAITADVGGTIVPDGYNNPVHATYDRSYARGEKYGIYFSARSQTMRKFLSIPIEANVLMPYRRDIKAGESLLYSDAPCWAGNRTVDGVNPVTETFEAFEQGTRAKTDLLSLVNASVPAYDFTTFTGVGRIGPSLAVPSFPAGTVALAAPFDVDGVLTPGFRFDGANSPGALALWQPATNFGDSHSYNIPPNTGRLFSATNETPIFVPNTGTIFAPTPQALGVGIYGAQNLPPEIGSFSISRTAPAGRIVAQGIGIYNLSTPSGVGNCAKKSTSSLRAFFPDIAANLVDQSSRESIEQNPGDYSIHCVPVGFYSEVYGYHGTDEFFGQRASRIDMVSYANLLHDEGQVNVGDLTPHGAQPVGGAPPGNYTAAGWWRQIAEPTGSIFRQPGNDGNTLLTLSSFTPVTSGRGQYYYITTNDDIYTTQGSIDTTTNNFGNSAVRDFHEPWYIISIVRTGAEAPNDNEVPTVDTGFNIKLDATVGIQQDANAAVYPLVDERWEDCLGEFTTDYRYIWITPPTGGTEAWVCITNNAFFAIPANTATVLAAIAGGGWTSPDGILVTGLYEATRTDVRLGFAYPQFIPPAGSRINVRYNDQALLRVLGGDVTIAPAIFAPEDNLLNTEPDTGGSEGFSLIGCPLPYAGFQLNPRYLMPWKSAETEQHINISYTETIRQWCVTFLCESRVPQALNVNIDGDIANNLPNDELQFFPAKHYVIRPYGNTNDLSGFYPQYSQAYPNEGSIIDYGGFRFLPGTNLIYAKQPQIDYESVPVVGYEEKLDGCNWLLASTKLNPQQQDVPGIRTFLQSGVRVISEETGPIWRIGSATHDQGQNMFIWTERAVGRILVEKNVLTGADGETVALQAIDVFWGQEQWLSRTTGLPKQLRNLWTRWENSFWWPDKKGFWSLPGDFRNSISSTKYDTKVLPLLDAVPVDYDRRVCAAYDPIHKEVWFAIPDMRAYPSVIATRMVVYNTVMNEWVGEFTYEGDQFLNFGQDMLGFRDLTTYTMNTGYTLNGQPLEAWVESVFCPYQGMETEAVWFRDNPTKPSRIEIRDQDGTLMFFTDAATWGPRWVLKIDGYENAVGMTTGGYANPRRRVTSTTLFKRTIHNEPVPFVEQISSMQLKQIV
jgi:hypothetical protein